MAHKDRLEELREQWTRAIERDRHADAVKVLVALEELEPDEPQWSHRLGEAYRRLGRGKEAEDAFVRAAERYVLKGFLPRAIAMAKLVASLNPARADLLARIAPEPAPMPPPVALVPLEPAADSSVDELRFMDSGEPSTIQVALEEVSSVTMLPSEEVIFDVSTSTMVDAIPSTGYLPPPQEPSIDRLATMAAFRLFAGVSRDALLALSAAAELVEFAPRATVIVRDEPAYALYAIIEGRAAVLVRGHATALLGEGDVFGEACLLDEGERQADVRAETALMTLRITKQAIDEATRSFPEIADALFGLLARRLVVNLLHTSPLFTPFEPEQRLAFAQMFEVRRAEPGTLITERGRRSDALYILLAGHASVADASGAKTRVARGTAFGHASLLGGQPADATIEAVSSAVLLRLPAAKFASLAAFYPPALAYLSEIANEPIPESVRTLEPE